ncbi:HEAT repeat domain-containing protein [Hyunsoonleella ulvae]|uniref:HEAT repeat domain-containing protein n=1 Tax=Hyunsoonleella ulvae TaxID=2799948 RepID=UPI001EF0F7F5|nr:HEAT repeat domain-containing protein [Hyunsoonleella ulvae]
MLHNITYILFKLKVLQPSERAINFWMEHKDVRKLEYALKHGNYKTRKLAAEALAYTGQCSSVPVLLHAMNDKVQNVSIAALNTLEALGCGDDLIISITKKRFNWVKEIRDKEAKQIANKDKKYTIYRWERTSKKSFERVKEQLKRPMR